ncbi:type III secretion system needle filament subunit SctF [Glaciimonas sp. Gout2]|uniref:type III secretion system needle filament subunit SctF n=1 Tax=unclassified Glaciimonas TaxID=2644401 RepID=UPI002B22C9FD|nr:MULTISPECIES: type III secretion system needle filament subunit SctF [unclassified Glaciimonas]MEB0010306.1 type III secretion system needle filament subunit SctF [Glaciimonas sp. Cout2]MEB0084771.1 type III secretion system needle filament subunit SctF [Glaciimonas sp. Gout2]
MAAYPGNGLMVSIAKAFEDGGQELFDREKTLREQLSGGNSSNPTLLAEYQAVISEMSILRNAQSSTVKAFKDMDATIVANFR